MQFGPRRGESPQAESGSCLAVTGEADPRRPSTLFDLRVAALRRAVGPLLDFFFLGGGAIFGVEFHRRRRA